LDAEMAASLLVPSALTFVTPCADPCAEPTFDLKVLQKYTKPEIRTLLADMLARENEMRLSPLSQQCFAKIGERHDLFNKFVTKLQERVCLEFGVDPSVGVELIRSAVSLFPDDKELHQIAHYVKFNRCKRGELRAGDAVADAQVTSVDGSEKLQLKQLIHNDRPVVLMGGSHT
jgi:hypothetical protein